jgi:putative DNA primase/helicase
MIEHSLRQIAHALGGEVSGCEVRAPGPGHGPRDRSLSVKLSASSPDGFLVHSFAGDDFKHCRDYVKSKLGVSQFEPRIREPKPTIAGDDKSQIERPSQNRRRLPERGGRE